MGGFTVFVLLQKLRKILQKIFQKYLTDPWFRKSTFRKHPLFSFVCLLLFFSTCFAYPASVLPLWSSKKNADFFVAFFVFLFFQTLISLEILKPSPQLWKSLDGSACACKMKSCLFGFLIQRATLTRSMMPTKLHGLQFWTIGRKRHWRDTGHCSARQLPCMSTSPAFVFINRDGKKTAQVLVF